MENAIHAKVPTYEGAPTSEIDMALVCGADKVFSPATKAENILQVCFFFRSYQTKLSKKLEFFQRITNELSGLEFDWTMNSDEAFFTGKEMIVGMRGDFRLRNRSSHLQLSLAKPVWYTDRSICWTINDTLVNSFAKHAYREGYFNTTVNLVYEVDMPAEIRPQVAAFCPGKTFVV